MDDGNTQKPNITFMKLKTISNHYFEYGFFFEIQAQKKSTIVGLINERFQIRPNNTFIFKN